MTCVLCALLGSCMTTIGANDKVSKKQKEMQEELRNEPLMNFYSMNVNAFALHRQEIILKRTDNGGVLTVARGFEEEDSQKVQKVEVADSILDHVRNLIVDGLLFDLKDSYYPEFDITDATSWSLDFKLGTKKFGSSGYAVGPDHAETLREIEQYLCTLYEERTR